MTGERSALGVFEKWLSLWVAICIAGGVVLGNVAPALFEALAKAEFASVNLIVAVLIWAMVYPMMVNVDFASLAHIGDRPKGLIVTLTVNWLVKPFSMAALGRAVLQVSVCGSDSASGRRAIHRGADPARGRALHRHGLCVESAHSGRRHVHAGAGLGQRHRHDFRVRPDRRTAPRRDRHRRAVGTLLLVGGPVRRDPTRGRRPHPARARDPRRKARLARDAVDRFTSAVKPVSILGCSRRWCLLFGFQGQVILERPLLIGLIAVPLVLQSYGVFFLAYFAAAGLKIPFNVAAPCALIGTSNFFELAVAVAISLFGLKSGAALATVVGVLVEVPVMLSLVAVANRTQRWFPQA